MQYNKLVRDKIPDIIVKSGMTPITHIADDNEYWNKLKEKLQEELSEVLEEKNIPEELADMLEVIHAICDYKGFTIEEVEKIRIKKLLERGGFKNRIILDETK